MCTVSADHVNIEAGPPPMDASASGVRMRNGSFIAGWIGKADASQVVVSRQSQKKLTLGDAYIARIMMRPVPMELAANIGRGRTGVLLASGDFYEGEFREVRDGRVTVDSVVFGVRTFGESTKRLIITSYHIGIDDVYLFRTPHLPTLTRDWRERNVVHDHLLDRNDAVVIADHVIQARRSGHVFLQGIDQEHGRAVRQILEVDDERICGRCR